MKMLYLCQGDFRTYFEKLVSGFFALVLTDPPYGRHFLYSWRDLAVFAEHVLMPGGFFVSYSGNRFLPPVISALSSTLEWYWIGGVQHCLPVTYPELRIRNCVKPLLILNKPPQRAPEQPFDDLLTMGSRSKRWHPYEQDVEEARALVRTFTKPGDWVLDPCVGSGTVLEAAAREGRNAVGIEIDPEAFKTANTRLCRSGICSVPELRECS